MPEEEEPGGSEASPHAAGPEAVANHLDDAAEPHDDADVRGVPENWDDFDPERATSDPLYLRNFLQRIRGELIDRGDAKDRDVPRAAIVVDRPALPEGHDVPYGEPRIRDAAGNPQAVPLFDGPPKREEAVQGRLGDCWLIASLGAVAGRQPQAVRDLVTKSPDGSFAVALHQVRLGRATGDWLPTGGSISLRG